MPARTSRRSSGALLATVILAGALGCQAELAPASSALLEPEGPTLEIVGLAQASPPASDAPAVHRVAFRMPDGSLRPVDREAIGFLPRWGQGAALVDPSRRLYEVQPDGARRMLAAEAIGVLATDGARLAYVTERDFLASLHVHDGQRDEVWASGLASIGSLRFVGDELLFVGGAPGGVAGLYAASSEGPRCLTNCALRTGTDWRSAHVPLPSDVDAIALEPDRLTYTDALGVAHEVLR